MDIDKIIKASDKAYDDLKNFSAKEEEVVADVTIPQKRLPDVYQDIANKAYEDSKRPVKHGSDKAVLMAVKAVADTLAPQYRQYKGQYEHLLDIGEQQRAAQLRQQYMVQNFLPAVEAVVLRTSPDDLLNSKQGMQMLNAYSGAIADTGYLEGYIRQAYGDMLGQTADLSDAETIHKLQKIRRLSEQGLARAACAEAKELKRRIDNGEQMASQSDYIVISRVAYS